MSSHNQPSKDELAERIELVRSLIARCLTTSMIKRVVRQKCGDLDHRTILGYIARARRNILADAARGREQMRAESQAFYESVLADTKVSVHDKLRARERIDKLHGLEAPQEHTVTATSSLELVEEIVDAPVTRNGQAHGYNNGRPTG